MTPIRLAFHRDVLAYRNCLMVEQPNGDFGQTIARQFLFSTYQLALYEALVHSTEPRLAEIAAKAVKEVRYHAELAGEWVVRLGDGTEESRERMVDGLDWHWRFVDELFQMDAVERFLAERGVAVDKATLRAGFDATLVKVLGEATISLPEYPRAVVGGRKGHHSEHLGHLLAVMQYLPRTYPERGLVGRAMLVTLDQDAERRVMAALADVPDPEIPVVSVVDLGIVRGIRRGQDGRAAAVLITPTYSGCPATLTIEMSVRDALDRAGFAELPIETVLSPPLEHRLDHRPGPPPTQGLWHRAAAQGRGGAIAARAGCGRVARAARRRTPSR